jgi:hypothetical protein
MTLLVLVMSSMFVSILNSQEDQSNQVRFVRIPSSPIQMTLNAVTGFVDIDILSGGNITAYAFGCVIHKEDRYVMRQRFDKTRVNFRERDYFLNRASLERLAMRCKSQELVAIVEVEFEDGGIWTAPR